MANKVAFLTSELQRMLKTSVDTTKAEWKEALAIDEKQLKDFEGHVRTLSGGGKVDNISLERAKQVVNGLRTVIVNKKKLIKTLSGKTSSRMTKKDWVDALDYEQEELKKIELFVRSFSNGKAKDPILSKAQKVVPALKKVIEFKKKVIESFN